MKGSFIIPKLVAGLAIVFILLGWQLSAILIKLPLILPTPGEALTQISILIVTGEFWRHLWATLSRGLSGFGLALIAGLLIGFLCGRNSYVDAFFRPLIILMRSTPVISVIILALIWFKRETVPVFVVISMTFPVVIQNIIEGIKNIDNNLAEMIRIYRVTNWRRITHFYLPSLIPFLAAGVSTGLGITWKVLIAAEVLSYPIWGIGAQMDTARVYLQTDKVFAWTLVVVTLGLIFDYGSDYILKKPFRTWLNAK